MKRLFLALSAFIVVLSVSAQTNNGYFVGKNYVAYNDSLMSTADIATFVDLGHGFAKDKAHVYNAGKIMEFVDPATFSIKQENGNDIQETQKASSSAVTSDNDDDVTFLDRILGTDEVSNKYMVTGENVAYNGKIIKKADAATFKYIGGEYAADKHHAYYKGRILGDAWGVGQFTYKGNGYASDGVHWYCNGKPVDRD